MKHLIKVFLFGISVVSISTGVVGCRSNSESFDKVKQVSRIEIKSEKVDAMEVSSEQKELNSPFYKFAKEADDRLRMNEEKIVKLKLKPADALGESRTTYLLKVRSLEKRNSYLKAKLQTYVSIGNGNWYTFRDELYAELHDLEESFRMV
ncbi:MAG: hypothetical protein KA444_07855 [Bacteroidia bacterium]|nr:hypothetical protein [Bacteroidia bacterium]